METSEMEQIHEKLDWIIRELQNRSFQTDEKRPFVDVLINHIKDQGWVQWSNVRKYLKENLIEWDCSQPTADSRLKICQQFGVQMMRKDGWAKFIRYDTPQTTKQTLPDMTKQTLPDMLENSYCARLISEQGNHEQDEYVELDAFEREK